MNKLNKHFQTVALAGNEPSLGLVAEERFGSVPKTFVRTSIDKMIFPALQDAMIKNWEVDSVFELESGHFPTSSVPAELADVLLRAAATNTSKLVSNA